MPVTALLSVSDGSQQGGGADSSSLLTDSLGRAGVAGGDLGPRWGLVFPLPPPASHLADAVPPASSVPQPSPQNCSAVFGTSPLILVRSSAPELYFVAGGGLLSLS